MMTREQRRRRKKRIWYCKLAAVGFALLVFIGVIIFGVIAVVKALTSTDGVLKKTESGTVIEEMLLTVCDDTRPGEKLSAINGIVIHCTGAPGVTAIEDRNYYERLHITNVSAEKPVYASVHFIIGLEGEIIQTIPTDEVAYASGKRNGDTIAIEYCHNDRSGQTENAAYKSLTELIALLCSEYELPSSAVMRHSDISDVNCPAYFSGANWDKLIADVRAIIEK